MKILDATCGTKAMWFEKNHPLVTYLDKRNGNFIAWNKKKAKRQDTIRINPNIIADWTKTIPFDDNEFDMVIFDPPHIVKEKEPNMVMINRYGCLLEDNWMDVIIAGINELFRVLKSNGVLIFKWAETSKNIDDVIKLFPYKPIFGSQYNSSKIDKTGMVHWLVFLKYDVNMKLEVNY